MSAWTTQAYAATPTKGCSYVARVEFVHGERTFKPGDVYPLVELGVHEVTAYGMWRSGMLAVAAPEAPPTIVTPPPAVPSPPFRPAKFQRR